MTNLIERDRQFVWHPFTQHETEAAPVAISHAKNTTLFTEDGREMLDLISSWWTCLHGHSHPALNEALAKQAEAMAHVMFAGFTHAPAVDIAERLVTNLPGDLGHVFYSDNGSTAIEVALKIAFQSWKNDGEQNRKLFIAFEGGYHGDTLGAMSVGKGSGYFKLFEDLMCEVVTIPYAHTWAFDDKAEENEQKSLAILDELLTKRGDEVAALIVEPLMQGAAGMRFCRPDFIQQVTERIRKASGLVIFDEIATGFGRTGSMFACQQAGVTPDLICLSKGLTGGYMPMSVTVARDPIFKKFLGQDFGRALAHGHSYTANPLGCAVANRSLALFEEENTLQKIARINELHSARLQELNSLPSVEQPRVLGTILACNLAEDTGSYKSKTSLALRDWYLQKGLNIRPIGNVVYLMPPYCITDAELARAHDDMIEGIKAVCSG